MPFLSEEVWHLIDNRKNDIIISDWPISNDIDKNILDDFTIVSEVVSSIRNFRKQSQVPNKNLISLHVIDNEKNLEKMDSIIIKLGNLESIEYINHKENKSYSFMVKSNEYFIPLSGNIDLEEELQKLKKRA